jgi:hypothetical protein
MIWHHYYRCVSPFSIPNFKNLATLHMKNFFLDITANNQLWTIHDGDMWDFYFIKFNLHSCHQWLAVNVYAHHYKGHTHIFAQKDLGIKSLHKNAERTYLQELKLTYFNISCLFNIYSFWCGFVRKYFNRSRITGTIEKQHLLSDNDYNLHHRHWTSSMPLNLDVSIN